MVDYTGTNHLPVRWGAYFPFLAPYGIFKAKDREFYIGASTDAMWTRLCEAIDRHDLLKDPRFLTNADRSKNQTELYEIFVPLFKEKNAHEWTDLATQLNIPNSLIHDLSEVVQQEQALSRDAIIPIGGVDKVRSAGIPIKLSRTPGQVRKAPPSLAEDADDILASLGITEDEAKNLRASGAIL